MASSEITLAERPATYVPPKGRARMGHAVLTSARILLFDQKWLPSTGFAIGGPLAAAVAEKLQERHEAGGPFLDLALSDVAAVERGRKGLNKDVLVVRTRGGEEHRFIGMYSDWSPLIERHLP